MLCPATPAAGLLMAVQWVSGDEMTVRVLALTAFGPVSTHSNVTPDVVPAAPVVNSETFV